jgi:hypothetical protein
MWVTNKLRGTCLLPRVIFFFFKCQESPSIFVGRGYWLEPFRPIIPYWPELFRPIIPNWPELFRPIIPNWPELFRPIIPYKPELFRPINPYWPELRRPIPANKLLLAQQN